MLVGIVGEGSNKAVIIKTKGIRVTMPVASIICVCKEQTAGFLARSLPRAHDLGRNESGLKNIVLETGIHRVVGALYTMATLAVEAVWARKMRCFAYYFAGRLLRQA